MYILKKNTNGNITYEINDNPVRQDILSSNGWIIDRYLLNKYFGETCIFVKYLEFNLIDLQALNHTYLLMNNNPHIYNDSVYHMNIIEEELEYYRTLLHLANNWPRDIYNIAHNNWIIIDRYIETEFKRLGIKQEDYTHERLSKVMTRIVECWDRDYVEFINNELINLYTNMQRIQDIINKRVSSSTV
jgi:hypothetical protein